MARRCSISQKSKLNGFQISHAHNKSKKLWQVNLVQKRLFDSTTNSWVSVRVSSRILRTINRKGLAATLRDYGLKLDDIRA